MVQIKEMPHFLPDGHIDLTHWLDVIYQKYNAEQTRLIHNACLLSQLADEEHSTLTEISCFQQGLAMGEVLAHLDLDHETIAAAIVYESVEHGNLSLTDIEEQLGKKIAKLVDGAEQMNAIHGLQSKGFQQSHMQLDNLRKMLLAMVKDIRVVLIKLAEQLCLLRFAKLASSIGRLRVAKEALELYAPLANRLGLTDMKWEMEDRAFRLLEFDSYRAIADQLHERRIDREKYVKDVMELYKQALTETGLKNFSLSSRVKHIYSIYRKMERKNVDFDHVFDINAIRVIVKDEQDCYTALSIAHALWQHIPEEFDDYIATPKPNGYQSIHTAICGPGNKRVEIQIRTQKMHEENELGVAAHWMYKEDGKQRSGYENKIAWLRQVLAWQKELIGTGNIVEEVSHQAFDDRIYVFTPGNDIVDLALDATPLDFAYHIHSEVGNRCRGAKVNGQIVPLTTSLHTGDKVEILTSKQSTPSRDWLSPHSGYLKTSRARAKVHHWFKQQDYDKDLAAGRDLLETELRKLNQPSSHYTAIAQSLNYKSSDDMLAALGRGDLRKMQIINPILRNLGLPTSEQEKTTEFEVKTTAPVSQPKNTDFTIEGVEGLLTYTAGCCKPVPGDSIVGYITVNRGIAIHRDDCKNINNNNPDRLVDVSWSTKIAQKYPVDLYICAIDRAGLLKDITIILANEKVNLTGALTNTDRSEQKALLTINIEIEDISALGKIINQLKQLPDIIKVERN